MTGIWHQRGMTMWGMIFVLGVLAFTLFIAFKLIPPYLNDMKIRTAMKSLEKEAAASPMSRDDIVGGLNKRLSIDMAATVVDLRKDLTIQASGSGREVKLVYDVVVPLFGNISLLLDFQHVAYVSGGG